MKSFRIYLRNPTKTPDLIKTPQKVAVDYSAEEKRDIMRSFAPRARRYRQQQWAVYVAFAAFILSILVGQLLPLPFLSKIVPITFCSWTVCMVITLLKPRLICPGCTNNLLGRIGNYCPECGAQAVEPGDWLHAPSCSNCRRMLVRSKSQRYKIRFCSHCGLALDEAGLRS